MKYYIFHRIRLSLTLYLFLILLLVNIFVCYVFYLCQTMSILEDVSWISFSADVYNKYLVNNSKCRIPDINPWNEDALRFYERKEYKDCTKKPLLTKILKEGDRVFLRVEPQAVPYYCSKELHCCYHNITRDAKASVPDNNIIISPCLDFTDSFEVHNDVVLVKCFCHNLWNREVYKNTHATTFMTKEFKKRKLKFGRLRPPSVLVVGIDSISRLNFYRTLPSTSAYFTSKNWISYKAYNKVQLNTFPNLMALLTGRNLNAIRNISSVYDNFFDVHDMLWNDYRRLGYVTAYAEDMAEINTFNFLKKGFKEKPTDFYFRHYSQITERLPIEWDEGGISCVGPEVYASKILNLATDFVITFRQQPTFGFFWMNSFSHDDMNGPKKMDKILVEFFENLEKNLITKDTIIIFLSDHGYRFGTFRLTATGAMEDRLPSLHFYLPESFKNGHKENYENFRGNSALLTSPFDLYVTLQHLPALSGLKHVAKMSVSCPKCKSLFSKTQEVRSCQDAAIDVQWCTCISYRDVSAPNALINNITAFVIGEIEKIVFNSTQAVSKCALLAVNKVMRSRISDNYENGTYVTIIFETTPRLTLEATIRLEGREPNANFFVEGEINRIDLYKYTSSCVTTEQLKKYCYCKSHLSFLSWIGSWLQD